MCHSSHNRCISPSSGYTLASMKDALRFLVRSRSLTVSCALIVALGVAMSTLLFTVVKATLIDPWPYSGAERIVTIRANYPEQGRERFALWSRRRCSIWHGRSRCSTR